MFKTAQNRLRLVVGVALLAAGAATVALSQSLRASSRVNTQGALTTQGPLSSLAPPVRPEYSQEANEALLHIFNYVGRKPTLGKADALYLESVGEGLPERERREVREWALVLMVELRGHIEDDATFDVVVRTAVRSFSDPHRSIRMLAVGLSRRKPLSDHPLIRQEAARVMMTDPDGRVREFARTAFPDLAPPGSVPEPPQ